MKKLIFTFILATLCGISAFAYDFSAVCESGQTLYYTITSSSPYKVKVVSQNTTSPYYSTYPTGDLTIPLSVTYNSKTYSVASIGNVAFYGCSGLTSVTIPNSVTSIGNFAFDSCSGLTAVYYAGTIAQWCGISFYSYDSNPLYYAHNLYINNSLVTNLVVPNTVAEIKKYAFYEATCLTSVNIPNSVTSIGNSAFYNCSGLTSITIPNSVTSIGESAFSGCSGLEEMTIPFVGGSATATTASESTLFGYIFGTASYEGGTGVRQYYSSSSTTWYYIPSNIRSVTVTDGSLLYGAFYGCAMLTSVTISDSVTSIGDYAFSGCRGLTSVTIPNSVTSIGDYAFSACSGLTSVTIPNSVTSIGNYAFYNCRGLSIVNFNALNCTTMGSSSYPVFNGCESLATLNISDSVRNIPAYAFYGCSGLTSVTIPNSVTSIGGRAFSGCSGLVEMTIPFVGGSATATTASRTTLFGFIFSTESYSGSTLVKQFYSGFPGNPENNNYATYYIPSSLRSVTVTDGSLLHGAFCGCSMLTSVTIGNSVTRIGDHAFSQCNELTSVYYTGSIEQWCGISFGFGEGNPLTCAHNLYIDNNLVTNLVIPETITEIKSYAFFGASCLRSVAIPNSVTRIGGYAFKNCSGLTSLTIPNSVTSIGQFAFDGCSGLTTVNFNAVNCTTMGSSSYPVFNGCTSLATLNISDSVRNIPAYAFSRCSGLTGSLTIPNSTTNVGESAFSGCSGLTELSLGESVATIGNFAFLNCSGLTSVTVDEGNPVYDSRDNCNAIIETETNTLIVGCKNTDIPNSVTSIGNYAFYNCTGLTSVTIPNSVTSIGNSAFSGCSVLVDMTIPFVGESATATTASASTLFGYIFGTSSYTGGISTKQYYSSDNYVTYYIPSALRNVTVIGGNLLYGAFYGCSMLTSVTIGNSVISIDSKAFSRCSGLATVNFNAENCEASGTETDPVFPSSALSKITFGESVRRVPDYAFYSSLLVDTIISYAVNPPTIYAHTFNFSEFPLSIPVIVPCGTVELYNDANYWYNFRRIQQRAGCGATFTITVQSNNSNYGTVSGGGIYEANAVAILTATPSNGCYFRNWSDGSRENPHRVTVTEDATYIATFLEGEPEPDITHSFSASACGSYTWNDHTYTQSGTYTQTFTAANYADSVVTLTLTIYDNLVPQISQSGELDACNPSSVTLSAGDYSTYNWSTGATTATISISEPGYYYVEVTDENGCMGISEQTNVGLSNALTEAPQISVVGMNSENHNVVAWSAVDNENVNAYRIYRENNVANVYEPMATVEALQTTWTDSTADPTARAYRYKVTAVDECGGESPMSDYHKTMHLAINQGIGNTWNLIWSHYEGFNFGTYRIYRGTSPSNMTMIGEVPSNLNSYTDNTATDNTGFYYQVEVVRNNRSRDAEISSRSNIVDNGIFPEYTITVISANPNRGTVTGGGTYPEGTVITIEATALDGFVFASWSDENTENPRQITVTGNATYIASFDEVSTVPEYTITVMSANPNRGTVTGGGTYPEGTIVRIEATALDGFVFTSWSDDNTDNPRYITVTENATYIASFDPATSIDENVALEINVFPNPANDILNITSSETISEIEIVNVMGQVVKRMEVNADNVVCDVEELKAGVYVVRISTASATLSQQRFIKE